MTSPIKQKKEVADSGRWRYFDLKIYVQFLNLQNDSWKQTLTWIQVFRIADFVTQFQLEKTLQNLKINYGQKVVEIEDFSGQLEIETKTQFPYWHIFLKTSHFITRRVLLKEISEALNFNSNSRSLKIEISFQSKNFQLMRSELYRFSSDELDSDWSPGFFTKELVKTFLSFESQEFQEAFRNGPKKYHKIFYDLLNQL